MFDIIGALGRGEGGVELQPDTFWAQNHNWLSAIKNRRMLDIIDGGGGKERVLSLSLAPFWLKSTVDYRQ